MKLYDLQKQIMSTQENDDTLLMVLVTNITLEPYFTPYLKHLFSSAHKNITIIQISYEEWQNTQSIDVFKEAHYIVTLINIESLYPNLGGDFASKIGSPDSFINKVIDNCTKFYFSIKHFAPIIWFGFEDYYSKHSYVNGNVPLICNMVDKINISIASKIIDDGALFIDLKRLIANNGIQNSYDTKSKYRWNAPYTKQIVCDICDEIFKQYCIHNSLTKKCLVLDCDNVLWGGIVSEDGVENIVLGNNGKGKLYQDFQRFLLYLYHHGVILTICSKNNYTDIIDLLNIHSGMILKEKHFAIINANWNNKVENIKTISETLNIGLNSIVFIDDSDFEINAVKSILPEVTTIKYDNTIVYEQLSCFSLKNKTNTEEIERRINTYITNKERSQLQAQCNHFEEYLQELEQVINIQKALPYEFNRISELTQKTNRYTNGTRYTIEQLKALVYDSTYELYSVYVSDRFSDLGLVGVIGIKDALLDLFSLSCRALGRGVEDKMFSFLNEKKISAYNFIESSINLELLNRLKDLNLKTGIVIK